MAEAPKTPNELVCYLNGGHQWDERSNDIVRRYCGKRKGDEKSTR